MKGYRVINSGGTIRKGEKRKSFFKCFALELKQFFNSLKGKTTQYE